MIHEWTLPAAKLVGLLALALEGVAPSTPRTAPAESIDLGQEIVVRVSGKPIFYVTSALGGLDAFDASDGKKLWHSAEASAPLVIRDGRLLVIASGTASAGPCRLLELNAETGAVEGPPLTLPPEVVLDKRSGSNGTVAARSIGGRYVVLWQTTTAAQPGTPAPSSQGKSPSFVTRGALIVDLAARTVVPSSEAFPPPRFERTERLGVTGFEVTPFDVDGIHVQIVRVPQEVGPPKAVMRRTRSGAPLSDVLLGENSSPGDPVLPAQDHHHVLKITRRDMPPMADRQLFDVAVFAVDSGKRVGAFAVDDPPSGFVVLGRLLFYRSYKRGGQVDHIGVRDLDDPTKPVFVRPVQRLR